MAAPFSSSDVHQFEIKFDGSPQNDEYTLNILEIVVEKSLTLPNACSIRYDVQPVEDQMLKVLDSKELREGKQVAVSLGWVNHMVEVFEGEVVSTDVDLNSGAPSSLTVRCLDKMHRLHRERKQRTFTNATDSDIFTQIVRDGGLTPRPDSTSTVHEWIVQDNRTDWEMLQILAKRSGHRVYYDTKNRTVRFAKVSDITSPALSIEWGEHVLSFRARTTASPQVDEVVVRGWDPKAKKVIVGSSRSANGVPKLKQGEHGTKVGQSAFGSAKHTIVNNFVSSESHAKEIAQSIFDKRAHSFIELDALIVGVPTLEPGDAVEVKGVGDRYGGTFTITNVVHTMNGHSGFTTQVSVEGKQSGSLMALIKESSEHD